MIVNILEPTGVILPDPAAGGGCHNNAKGEKHST